MYFENKRKNFKSNLVLVIVLESRGFFYREFTQKRDRYNYMVIVLSFSLLEA